MNSFEHAGEALLQLHEGNRQIGQAMGRGLRSFLRDVVRTFVAVWSLPHRAR